MLQLVVVALFLLGAVDAQICNSTTQTCVAYNTVTNVAATISLLQTTKAGNNVPYAAFTVQRGSVSNAQTSAISNFNPSTNGAVLVFESVSLTCDNDKKAGFSQGRNTPGFYTCATAVAQLNTGSDCVRFTAYTSGPFNITSGTPNNDTFISGETTLSQGAKYTAAYTSDGLLSTYSTVQSLDSLAGVWAAADANVLPPQYCANTSQYPLAVYYIASQFFSNSVVSAGVNATTSSVVVQKGGIPTTFAYSNVASCKYTSGAFVDANVYVQTDLQSSAGAGFAFPQSATAIQGFGRLLVSFNCPRIGLLDGSQLDFVEWSGLITLATAASSVYPVFVVMIALMFALF